MNVSPDSLIASKISNAVIADSCPLFLSLLEWFLKTEAKVASAFSAKDSNEVIQLAKSLQPDVIILDLFISPHDGLSSARKIKILSPNTKIIILSDRSQLIQLCHDYPIDFAVEKNGDLQGLMNALVSVRCDSTKRLANKLGSEEKEFQRVFKLTQTETMVLQGVIKCHTSTQIASVLSSNGKKKRTEQSVKQTIRRIMDKVGVEPRTRVALVQAIRNFNQSTSSRESSFY